MIPGVELKLGGKTYTIPPISLGALERLQARLKEYKKGGSGDDFSLVTDCLWSALKRNYPAIERDHVSENLIDISNMNDVMSAVMDVSGIKRKAQEAENLSASQS
jgi:hypothetical protein